MLDEKEVTKELRKHYGIIYQWHMKYGIEEYTKRYELRGKAADHEYSDFVRGLPHPRNADLKAIEQAARAVRSGCMEWAYCIEATPGLPLSKVAGRILDILNELHKQHEDESITAKLHQLHNIGEGAHIPSMVTIAIPHDIACDKEAYSRYAAIAYHDVGGNSANANLGGWVALADTNLEHEKKNADTSHSNVPSTLTFRNATALHLVEERHPDSLVGLIRSGALSVESIKIGTGE